MEVDDLIEKYRSPHSVAPMPALEGLDEVNWSGLQDAYGPANGIPALLRAFVSVDPEDREFADLLLCQTLWHQGNVYSATAAAIPFLYNLLEDEGPHNREAVAGIIGLIAEGQPPFVGIEDDLEEYAFWENILRPQGKSVEQFVEENIADGHEVLAAIRRERDLAAGHGFRFNPR
jgi:hypothetical protein